MAPAINDCSSDLANYLDQIVRGLVLKPEEVVIKNEASTGKTLTILRVTLDSSDIPLFIGKGGMTYRSVQTIMERAAKNKGFKVKLLVPPKPDTQSAKVL